MRNGMPALIGLLVLGGCTSAPSMDPLAGDPGKADAPDRCAAIEATIEGCLDAGGTEECLDAYDADRDFASCCELDDFWRDTCEHVGIEVSSLSQSCAVVPTDGDVPSLGFELRYRVRKDSGYDDGVLISSTVEVASWSSDESFFFAAADVASKARITFVSPETAAEVAQVDFGILPDIGGLDMTLRRDFDRGAVRGILSLNTDGPMTTYFVECSDYPFHGVELPGSVDWDTATGQ